MFKRLARAWFEFKGIRSTDMGIQLKSLPTRTVPAQKYTRKTVSGRNGTLTVSGGEYGDASVQQEMDVIDTDRMAEILGWLSGSGDLRFSDEPELIYKNASVEKEYQRKFIVPRATAQRFTVKWTCEPFRREYVESPDLMITASGTTISNPGTAEALPRIEIIGRGDFSVNIGIQTMFFAGVEDGIIIDSELGDAFTPDGSLLANDKCSGELFRIQPGANIVSWVTGGEDGDGTITKITIKPRWRYV